MGRSFFISQQENKMGDDNIINLDDLTPQKIARMRNLKPYKGKTDEEIRAIFSARRPKTRSVSVTTVVDPNISEYDRRFQAKMKILQTEFAIDMNNSNDAESLKNLVRLQIQLENGVKQIEDIQKIPDPSKDDVMVLKNLGDFQRSVMTSLADLQEKLGISRKQRKEKQIDDIPQYIDALLTKAKTYYDRKTITIDCPKCMIELSRYWLNFPGEKNDIEMSLTCWKCREVIEYTG
jgi:hypothetical protein